MAQEYAGKQPQGFKNRIEKVAIVGVSCYPRSYEVSHLGAHDLDRPAVNPANSS